MFTAALFIIAPNENNSNVQQQVNGWRSYGTNIPYAMYHVLFHPYMLEYHSAMKRNKPSDTYNMKESHRLYTEWKKPDMQDYILYDSLPMWRGKTIL